MTLGLQEIPTRPAGGTSESTLDQIRARFRKAKQGQHLDLGLPNLPELRVRYVPIEDDQMDELTQSDGTLGMDYLVHACECLLVRNEHGQWEPLIHDGEPVRYDETLSDILDLGVPPADRGGTARDVVLAVFSAAPSPKMAAGKHVARLTAWMSGGSIDEEAMLGES